MKRQQDPGKDKQGETSLPVRHPRSVMLAHRLFRVANQLGYVAHGHFRGLRGLKLYKSFRF